MKSVLQKNKECYVCGNDYTLHVHHVFSGTSNRKRSEEYGMKIYLCPHHHNMSDEGIHFNKSLDIAVKKNAQKYFEEHIGSREEFRTVFGKSYL